MSDFVVDFLAGGVSGAVSKTITAPIERVKLVIQTQDANPKIVSGEVPRYTGIGNCFTRIYQEQGFGAFWRGNLTNIIRYFPTQAFNLAFKDSIKAMFPKFDKNKDFWKFFGTQLASGGMAGACSLTIVYPLDYARTRLASDVGSGKAQFTSLWDCLSKTAGGPGGFISLYNGFGPSVAGIIAYRGAQFGLNDTIMAFNPYAKESGFVAICSKFVVAQIAVTASGLVAYPFDTVRRRMQMQSDKPKSEWLYKSSMDCAVKVLKDEGVGGMFKGALANIFRGVGASLVLVLYGEIKLAMAK
jgi:solute carrier family 25 (adenine nucleotide translocator) protein 4/5/6/31